MKLSQLLCILIVFETHFVVKSNDVSELFSFSAKDIHGEEVSLDAFKGKVILIVNVASKCGFTDIGYKELQQIYKDLGYDDHFTVLGFPCNQFGKQEPDPEETIEKFVKQDYNVEFPMFSKVDVKGNNAHPIWKYLVLKTGNEPKWNFFKYLIDHTGKIVDVFPSKTSLWKHDPEGIYNRIKKMVKDAKKFAKETKPKTVKKELREEL